MNNTVKTILILFIIVGALVLVFLFMRNGTEETPNQEQTTSQNQSDSPSEDASAPDTSSPSNSSDIAATVTYQNGSFEPQTITVQAGETVKFVNQGDGEMWVGSDEHPTHTEYDGTTVSEHCEDGDATSRVFDQCSPGQTYTFTFERSGEWDYHNHVNASAGGTVIVE